MIRVCWGLLLCGWTVGVVAADDPPEFIKTFCLECHQTADPSGDRDFQLLDLASNNFDTQVAVQEIIDQLTLGTMPPEDARQPTEKDRLKTIQELTERLEAMRADSSGPGDRAVLRRLSRREYRNTLRDLLAIDTTMFDPVADFPSDHIERQFDTDGDSLVTSAYLLEKYLEAADASVEKALALSKRPQLQSWKFDGNFFQQPELKMAHRVSFNNRYLCLYDHPLNEKPEGAYGYLSDFNQGVPVDGIYEVRVLAEALHRDTPYSLKAVNIVRDEPFRMGIVPGDTRISDMYHVQPIQPKLAETVVDDDQLKWYEFRIPLDRGFAPRFTFENGIHNVRNSYARVYRFDRDKLPEKIRNKKGIVDQRIAIIQHGNLPHIRIHEVQIRGPIDYPWPNASQQQVLGGQTFDTKEARSTIQRFAMRAYRRPPQAEDIDRWHEFYQNRVRQEREPMDALKDTLKAILCSPGFLYFQSSGESQQGQLDDFGVAERLSYFLTGSMPDQQLLDCASKGLLSNPKTLRQQTRRLLAKQVGQRRAADDFIEGFLDNWLNLHSLGTMPPDPGPFWSYYARGLEPKMKQETRLYMRDLIDRNDSALQLLDSNYTFANRDLARLYRVEDQIPPEQAHRFHKVTFDDSRRGGLLGQASILTVSANGIETSPVTRGVWILENILGTPTPPPPDDVPELDPDIRGANTIRDQLQKHRSNAACNLCHRKIDPLGFALECFDPIGQVRERYANRSKIDVSGVLPGGDPFDGPGELKKLLMERKEFFVRTLTQRLLSHAMGREMGPADRRSVDEVMAKLAPRDYPLRSLIEEIVVSDIFRQW